MKLFSAPGSCSSASHIALLEAGANFELVKLSLKGDRMLPDGRHLSDINPKGYVPILELDDGELLTENTAILQYIADQYADSKLAPANGTLQRVRLQEWLGFINSEVHKTFGSFFIPGLPAGMRSILMQRLDKRFDYINAELEGQEYLLADRFTVADCYLFVISGWSPMLGYDLSQFANVLTWQARIGERQTVKHAMAESAY